MSSTFPKQLFLQEHLHIVHETDQPPVSCSEIHNITLTFVRIAAGFLSRVGNSYHLHHHHSVCTKRAKAE